jgi:hypothetical protein
MINNTELITSLLDFQSDDDFYFMQVIKRRKENIDIGSDNIVINSYYCSQNNINTKINYAIELAKTTNSRVYFHLNKKSYEKVGVLTLKIISEHIYNNSFPAIKNAFDSACGQFTTKNKDDKTWIIDFDHKDEDVIKYLENCVKLCDPNKPIVAKIPTKNGVHLITKPFNVKQFLHQDMTIHKNNPTLLYCD